MSEPGSGSFDIEPLYRRANEATSRPSAIWRYACIMAMGLRRIRPPPDCGCKRPPKAGMLGRKPNTPSN
jgi:hypothetical protein